MRAILHEPTVVAMGPNWDEVGWGPWQFPTIGKTDDGTLVAGAHSGQDSEMSYGAEPYWFKSTDGGETWTEATALDGALSRTRLPNGDRVKVLEVPPKKDLVASIGDAKPAFIFEDYADCYYADDLNPEIFKREFNLQRVHPGDTEKHIDTAKITYWPYETVYNLHSGAGIIVPFLFGRTRTAPDGSLWATHYYYGTDPATGKEMGGHGAYFFRSTDGGKTFRLASWLDPTKTEGAGAFLEPDIGWTKDGKAIAMLRALTSFYAVSEDGGFTWGQPQKLFPGVDTGGVMPAICTLKCGGIIVSTGRPHFLIKTACDFDKNGWDDGYWDVCSDSCCYSEIVPLNDTEALVCYVDFQHPDSEGKLHKTIMTAKVSFVED